MITFIGLGAMGAPMARRLATAGHKLCLHDICTDIAARLADEIGATWAMTIPEAVDGARLVILMLPNSDAVRAVLTGAGGVAKHLRAGSLVIDMGSSDPSETQKLGVDLAMAGLTLLDAPVSGGVRGAIGGTLAIMLGGDNGEVCDRVTPMLKAMGKVFRTGRLGSGHATKAINNYLSAVGLAAACEAVLIGDAFGLDPATMIDVINASTGRSNSTENKIKPFVLSGEFRRAGFALDLMAKDIRTTSELSRRLGLTLTGPGAAQKLWEEAAQALGAGADHTEIFRYIASLGTQRKSALLRSGSQVS